MTGDRGLTEPKFVSNISIFNLTRSLSLVRELILYSDLECSIVGINRGTVGYFICHIPYHILPLNATNLVLCSFMFKRLDFDKTSQIKLIISTQSEREEPQKPPHIGLHRFLS
jgi:hypothetical protein